MMKLYTLLLLAGLFACTSPQAQQRVTAPVFTSDKLERFRQHFGDNIPDANGWVNDWAMIFSTGQRQQLDSIITDFEKTSAVQIAVLTLDSFSVAKGGVDQLAHRIFNKWRPGRKNEDKGILICICPGHRRMRIVNGKGIIPYLSNTLTQRMVDEQFFPSFKKGDYFRGTKKGLLAIMEKLRSRGI